MPILWVENHPRFVEFARRQFLRGHEVTVAMSLDAARGAVAHDAFDAVLVDFDLDDGKGDVFVRELRGRRMSPRVLVIAASAHQEGNDALLAAGADAVCGKLKFAGIAEVLKTLSESRPG
jgi:DNA-binding response OmpR family regulator